MSFNQIISCFKGVSPYSHEKVLVLRYTILGYQYQGYKVLEVWLKRVNLQADFVIFQDFAGEDDNDGLVIDEDRRPGKRKSIKLRLSVGSSGSNAETQKSLAQIDPVTESLTEIILILS